MSPPGRRSPVILKELGIHAVAVLLCLGVLTALFRLHSADLRYPLHLLSWWWGDGVYYGMLVKMTLETGGWLTSPDLGAPFGLELYDFPHFDAAHLLLIRAIGLFTSNWAVAFNVFYLLTYLLATTTSLALFRYCKVPALFAVPLALFFAFQPYHMDRAMDHIFLASYYHLPMMMFGVVWLTQRRSLGTSDEAGGVCSSGRCWAAGLLAFGGVFGGHYYAFFACYLYLIAGAGASILHRQWRNVLDAGGLAAVMGLAFAINLAPNTLYWARNGSNRVVSAKGPSASEMFSLRLTPLLLPSEHHPLRKFRELRRSYRAVTPLGDLESTSSIGLVAGAGLLALIGFGLVRRREEGAEEPTLTTLGGLTIASLLLATFGGFGALFSYLVSPQIHGYYRMGIVFALLGLLAVGLLLRRFARGWAGLALAALLLVGLLDQIGVNRVPSLEQVRERFDPSFAFGRTINAAVPRGTRIYRLPGLRKFPFGLYSGLSGYLITNGMQWADPGMLGRRSSLWMHEIEALPTAAFLERLALAGFGGLVLDASDKSGAAALADVRALVGPEKCADGQGHLFFDLRAFARAGRERSGPEEWRERQAGSLLPVGYSLRAGRIELKNFTGEPVRGEVRIELPEKQGLTVSGGLLPVGPVTAADGRAVFEVVVPVGRHVLKVETEGNGFEGARLSFCPAGGAARPALTRSDQEKP